MAEHMGDSGSKGPFAEREPPTHAGATAVVLEMLVNQFPTLGEDVDGLFRARVAAGVIVRELHYRRMLILADRHPPEDDHGEQF